MIPVYDEYRRKAAHCRQMAEHTGNPELKNEWLGLAAKWLSLIPPHEQPDEGTESRSDPQTGDGRSNSPQAG